MFFSCHDSVLGDFLQFHQGNRGSLPFDWEHGTPQHEMQGNRASSCGEGEVSCVFSRCGRHLVYILELRGDGNLKLGFVQRSQDSCLVMADTSGS